jgi:hypothetical protein
VEKPELRVASIQYFEEKKYFAERESYFLPHIVTALRLEMITRNGMI